jgi:hypothetical protein
LVAEEVRERMADETPKAAVSPEAPTTSFIGDVPLEFEEYTFQGSDDPNVGDEIFHRAAGPMKKGDKVMLTFGHAEELRSAGFKLTESKK